MEEEQGHQISVDQIQIITTLGFGTFGRVKLVKIRGYFFALKIMRKNQLLQQRQINHIKSEKKILLQISHPFLVECYTTFQDQYNVYMLFQYIPGGELFSRLSKDGRFSNDIVLFYVAQVLTSIIYLHQKNIIYRDLKPQNILLDKQGHTKIIDFGFAKKLTPNGRTKTMCGTPEYLAPEILDKKNKNGYGKSVDYWALGILIYQLLAGSPPFYDPKDPKQIYNKIFSGKINFPSFFSLRAKDIIRKLLNHNVNQRLGIDDNGKSIKEHKWFRRVNWEMILKKKVPIPWAPKLNGPSDISQFDKCPSSKQSFVRIMDKNQKYFEGF